MYRRDAFCGVCGRRRSLYCSFPRLIARLFDQAQTTVDCWPPPHVQLASLPKLYQTSHPIPVKFERGFPYSEFIAQYISIGFRGSSCLFARRTWLVARLLVLIARRTSLRGLCRHPRFAEFVLLISTSLVDRRLWFVGSSIARCSTLVSSRSFDPIK